MAKPTTHQELLRLIDQATAENWEELDLSGMGRSELPREIVRLTGLKQIPDNFPSLQTKFLL